MKYYECNGNLYTSNTPIVSQDFTEITKDEYELRFDKIKVEQPILSEEDVWDIGFDDATEQDYKDALTELGVNFNE